jgi:hypothetical protein
VICSYDEDMGPQEVCPLHLHLANYEVSSADASTKFLQRVVKSWIVGVVSSNGCSL